MNKIIPLWLLFFFIASGNAIALNPADSLCPEKLIAAGFEYVYDFKFNKADSLAGELKKKYPGDPKTYLLIANTFWYKLRSGDDNVKNRQQFLLALKEARSLLDKKKKSELNYEDLFFYIHVYSYMARLELLSDNYFKAFSFLNRCSEYLFTSFGKESKYEPLKLTTGLYRYYMIAARKKYPPLIPFLMLLPAGDKNEGLRLLAQCCESSIGNIQTEATYFLMIIYGESDINYSFSETYAEKLCRKYPNNLLYRYYFFKVLLLDEKKEPAMNEYKQLYRGSILNPDLSPAQRNYFIALAQKDLEVYYRKYRNKKT